MTDRPILFSGPMVRALLEDRKTQTRRVLKPQPNLFHWQYLQPMSPTDQRSRFRIVGEDYPDDDRDDVFVPYSVNDRLWVRESWGSIDADLPGIPDGRKPQIGDRLIFAANAGDYAQWGPHAHSCGNVCFRPSIHMPRWASRLTLIVTEVRVQRLQEISEEDTESEGINYWDGLGEHMSRFCHTRAYVHDEGGFECSCSDYSYQEIFAALWDSINASRKDRDGNRLPYAWADNPWVVAVSFDVHKVNIDQMKEVAA